jgi:thymidine kinase
MELSAHTHSMSAGTIELVVGPMFAGKSTELIRRMRRMQAARKQWLLLTYAGDSRYFGSAEVMGTHNRESFPARKVRRLLADVSDQELMREDVACVVVDEGQFFEDLAPAVRHWAFALNKHVVVAALNSTFQRLPWDTVSPLYAMASHIAHLLAVCARCGGEAPFTKRLAQSDDDDTAIVLVGGAERYEARCAHCFEL